MRTLVLQLYNRKNRPSFMYTSNGLDVTALMDSGAETPVWCTGERKVIKAYPEAVKLKWKAQIRGFGQKYEKASVYIIPRFSIKTPDEEYNIINLQIAVCNHSQIGYDFVMSDTMFSKTNTYINRLGKKYMEIYFEKDVYQCASKRGAGTFSIVTFSQEDISE